jgi:hypothetical protein
VKWVQDLACVMEDGWCGYRGSGIICYSRLIQLDLRMVLLEFFIIIGIFH